MIPDGYRFQTTFWNDFTIADAFGVKGIEDTYNRAHNEWKDNVSFYKEFTCVLNWKCWDWNEKDDEKSNCYCKLYEKAYAFGCSHFKGAEIREYLDFLD